MPASLKERSSRLQMFARLKSENEVKARSNADVTTNANFNGNAVAQQTREPERYQSSAPVLASVAERRELADSARVPVPGANARQSTIHQRRFSQPPPESVQRSHSQSPASQHRQMDIFTGSQLGDSFMNSGLTTPQYEPSEADPDQILDKRNAVVTAPALSAPTAAATSIARPTPRFNFDKRFLPNDGAAFQIGEDLLMKVVPGARQHNPTSTYMNDGFNRAAVNGYSRPFGNHRTTYTRPEASPEKQPKLPVREIKVRHVQRPRQMEYDDREKRSTSPAFATRGRWMKDREDDFRPTTRFRELEEVEDEEGMRGAAYEGENEDLDDGTSTVGGHEDGHATPRIRGHLLSPHRAALESVMATTVPPFQPLAPKDRKRRRMSLDYDDMALSSMSYADLQNEPFDFDPSKATTQMGSGGAAGTADTLTAKLEQGQHQSEQHQRSMFATMSLDDWEEAGDWFADQFAEIMHKLREARRNKRHVIQGFESEAASREEAVRQQSEALDRKLVQMKQDAQRVVTPNDG
ncbi:extracellular mutant protein 11 domain-containing protein [Trichoderma barbatum]